MQFIPYQNILACYRILDNQLEKSIKQTTEFIIIIWQQFRQHI